MRLQEVARLVQGRLRVGPLNVGPAGQGSEEIENLRAIEEFENFQDRQFRCGRREIGRDDRIEFVEELIFGLRPIVDRLDDLIDLGFGQPRKIFGRQLRFLARCLDPLVLDAFRDL